jgi:hypothetical protein
MKLSNGVDLGPKIRFCIEGDPNGDWPIFEGWNNGRWNGFLIPLVTEQTYDEIIKWQLKSLEDNPENKLDTDWMEQVEYMKEKTEHETIDGFYNVGWGLIWDIIES